MTVLQTEARKQTDEIWKQHVASGFYCHVAAEWRVQNHFWLNLRSITVPLQIICSLDLCPWSSVSMNYKKMSDFAPPLQLNAE